MYIYLILWIIIQCNATNFVAHIVLASVTESFSQKVSSFFPLTCFHHFVLGSLPYFLELDHTASLSCIPFIRDCYLETKFWVLSVSIGF